MKKLILFLALTSLLLSACNRDVSPPPTATGESVSAEAIFTAAAMTAFASVPSATPTPIATATATATIQPTATITPFDTVTPQSTATSGSASDTAFGCYDAAFVRDVTIPDGTLLQPGDLFTKTWEIRNTGSCPWESDFVLIFSSGDPMSGLDTLLGKQVAVGATESFSVDLVAPDTPGSYTGFWRLTNVEGTIFGEVVYVAINVDGDIPTPTPTP